MDDNETTSLNQKIDRIAAAIAAASNEFVRIRDIENFLFGSDYDYCGSGDVCRSLVIWFKKKREWFVKKIVHSRFMIRLNNLKKIVYRKTVKSLIEPVKFKGWKRSR